MITSEQIRAARALLGLDQTKLAALAHVSLATLRRAEANSGRPKTSLRVAAAIQHALESAGAEFVDDGVRRRRRRTAEEKEALFQDIMEIAKRSAKLQAENPGFSEDDLYDENGLPA